MRRSNAADYPPERLEPLIAYFSAAKLVQLASERTCLVVETVAGGVVGTAALEGDTLAAFFVHPDAQRHGVGTQLLGALEDWARATGSDRLTVDSSLTGASFYEHHGYRRTGQLVDGTAGPQIRMEKVLVASERNG
jgi:GNAT superfamily N-acetyltransferase